MTERKSYHLRKWKQGDELVGWYGGHPRGIRAQDWPKCRVCGAPMCHLCQFEAGPWMDIFPFQRLSVFICHATGGVCEDWDPFKGSNRVILHREQNNNLFDGPPTVRVYRRTRLAIDKVVENEAQNIATLHNSEVAPVPAIDKLGGVPDWIHPTTPPLTGPGNPMDLAVQITTEIVKFDITDKGRAFVFLDLESTGAPRGYMLWQGQ